MIDTYFGDLFLMGAPHPDGCFMSPARHSMLVTEMIGEMCSEPFDLSTGMILVFS